MEEDEVDHATLALTGALKHNRIGTEYILLGLLRDEEGWRRAGLGQIAGPVGDLERSQRLAPLLVNGASLDSGPWIPPRAAWSIGARRVEPKWMPSTRSRAWTMSV